MNELIAAALAVVNDAETIYDSDEGRNPFRLGVPTELIEALRQALKEVTK
jgi:hypothetical protein